MRFKRLAKKILMRLPSYRGCDYLIGLVEFWIAHRRLPSRNAILFNDYLFYLKISKKIDGPLRQLVSDKQLVKLFYKGVFMHDYTPRTFSQYFNFSDFSKSDIPRKCIVKPAHLSGGIFVNGGIPSLKESELSLVKEWFEKNIYYDINRERNYKNLIPSVICEEVVDAPDVVRDYKIFCYKGRARLIQVDVDRHALHKRRLYTKDWKPLEFPFDRPLAEVEPKPNGIDEALDLASVIATYFDFIRVDTFLVNGRVFLGELTNVPANAHDRFASKDDERMFMSILKGKY